MHKAAWSKHALLYADHIDTEVELTPALGTSSFFTVPAVVAVFDQFFHAFSVVPVVEKASTETLSAAVRDRRAAYTGMVRSRGSIDHSSPLERFLRLLDPSKSP